MASAKETRFCRLRAAGELSPLQCAIQAGYSPKTAESRALQLMSKRSVQERIKAFREAGWNEFVMPKPEALYRLSQAARFSPTEFMDENGRIDLKKLKESGVIVSEITVDYNEGEVSRVRIKGDQYKAIQELAKILGWNEPERHEHTFSMVELEDIRTTREITVHNQHNEQDSE